MSGSVIFTVIERLGPWAWVIAGLVLGALELIAPGVFLIWLGLAAVLTGVIDATFGLSWQASSIVFAVLAVACVIGGRMLSRHDRNETPEQPFLSRRGDALIGKSFVLETALLRGEGRIRVGDSVWRVTGPDMVAGAKVRVTGIEGTTLVVEST